MTRARRSHRPGKRPGAGHALACLAVLSASLAAGAAPSADGPPAGGWWVTAERFDSQTANHDIDLSTLLVERTLPLLDKLFIGVGAGVIAAEGSGTTSGTGTRDADATGVGTTASLRWMPVEVRGLRPFVAGSTGMVFTTDALPPGGERGNLWHRASLGLTVHLRPSLRLVAALRRIHMSGSRWMERDHGRHLDGNGVVLGLALRGP